MGSDLEVEHGPERAVNGVVRRLADTSRPRARPRVQRRDRARGGPARAGRTGGGRCATRSPPPGWRCAMTVGQRPGSAEPDQRDAAVARARRRPRRVAEVIASGWVAQGPRVAGSRTPSPASQQAEHAVAVVQLHHRAAPGAGRGRRRARRRRGRAVVLVHRHRQRRRRTSVPGRSSPTSTPATGNCHARTVAAVLTPATRAVIVVDQGGVPVDLDAIRALCDPLGHRRRRGRRLRRRLHVPRPPGRGRRRARRLVVPPAQDPHHRRGRDAHHLATRSGPTRARRLREHAMSVSAADRHAARAGAGRRSTARSASTTG